jgi:hypothetical protein
MEASAVEASAVEALSGFPVGGQEDRSRTGTTGDHALRRVLRDLGLRYRRGPCQKFPLATDGTVARSLRLA